MHVFFFIPGSDLRIPEEEKRIVESTKDFLQQFVRQEGIKPLKQIILDHAVLDHDMFGLGSSIFEVIDDPRRVSLLILVNTLQFIGLPHAMYGERVAEFSSWLAEAHREGQEWLLVVAPLVFVHAALRLLGPEHPRRSLVEVGYDRSDNRTHLLVTRATFHAASRVAKKAQARFDSVVIDYADFSGKPQYVRFDSH